MSAGIWTGLSILGIALLLLVVALLTPSRSRVYSSPDRPLSADQLPKVPGGPAPGALPPRQTVPPPCPPPSSGLMPQSDALAGVAAYADRCVELAGKQVDRGVVGSEIRLILAGDIPPRR